MRRKCLFFAVSELLLHFSEQEKGITETILYYMNLVLVVCVGGGWGCFFSYLRFSCFFDAISRWFLLI